MNGGRNIYRSGGDTRKGGAVYTPLALALYDLAVLVLSNSFVWLVPRMCSWISTQGGNSSSISSPAQLAAEHLAGISGVDCDNFRVCSYVVTDEHGLLGKNAEVSQDAD
jgi:uncharacterized ion transporter superfamily protein YfcC